MPLQNWPQIKEILADAIELETDEERRVFVDETCGNDAQLCREVQQLMGVPDGTIEACADHLRDTLERRIWAPLIGRLIGPWRVVREIGRGGMGTVYLAERADGQFQKKVAIKLLERGGETDEISHRFRSEWQILAQLEHPSIARLLDAGQTSDGQLYFIMEHVDGVPVTRFARAKNLTLPERLSLFLKICGGVQNAHRHSVIHRDLKPSNILITAEGEPKILDFGIAKLLSSPEAPLEETVTRYQRLTPHYASPEQARGDTVTTASDVYALGTLLYELLTSYTPHSFTTPRPTFAEVARVLSEGKPPLPSERVSELFTKKALRGDLDRIVDHALQIDPAKRYPSVAALAEDVERYLTGAAVAAPSIHQRRNRRLVAWLVAATMLAGGFALFYPRLTSHRGITPTVASVHSMAVLPFFVLGGDDKNELLGFGMADAVIDRMSGLRNLTILPTAAIARFKGSGDPIAAGRSLAVDAVLSGTIQRVGDRVRVTVQLADVQTRQTLWSTAWQESSDDIFSLQDSISSELARTLAGSLSPEDQRKLTKHNTENTAAYQAYLRGYAAYNTRTKAGLRQAVDEFNEALKRDPHYALAYALLADSYYLQGYYGYEPMDQSRQKARLAATEALHEDKSLAEGYVALSMTEVWNTHGDGAASLLKRAISLDPNLDTAHQRYAWLLCGEGNLQAALSEMKRAQQLNPLSAANNGALWLLTAFTGKLQEALPYALRAVELNPNDPNNQGNLAYAYAQNGRLKEAKECLQKVIQLDATRKDNTLIGMAIITLRSGDRAGAEQYVRQIEQRSPDSDVSPYDLAILYGTLGDKNAAFSWFDRAVAQSAFVPALVRYDPMLDPLRSDSRFAEILTRHGRGDLVGSNKR